MPGRGRRSFVAWAFLAAPPLLLAEDVKIAVGVVEDQRASDPRMGGLAVELKLTGSSVSDVKALRVKVKSAKDNLGTVLYKPGEEKTAEFDEFSPDRRPGPRVHLASPSRDASTVEVSGDVELFIPGRDSNTKQRFESFLDRIDKPMSASALKAAKVEITPLSPASYKARQQQNRPTKEEIMAEGKKHGASEAEIKQAIAVMDALAALGGEEPSETSVLLDTKDPDARIISIDVVRADGTELHASSRGSSGSHQTKLVKIDLSEKPPADAALVVTLRTPKSVVTVPLKWKDVALP
ncbi:MAG TPA: hypothetical protein VIZ69_05500 [Thermoanaerobaculia bacterium]